MAALLGPLEQAVLLSVHRLGEDAYGRSILRSVELALDRDTSSGSVYATLDRLEQQRLLSSRLEKGTAARAGRPRRFYRVSAAGVCALNQARSALDRIWHGAASPLELRS
jgi:DNA-binding PadR family transcriptional regulator